MSKGEIAKREQPDPAMVAEGSPIHVAIQTAAALGKDGVEVLERLRVMLGEERAAQAKREGIKALAAARDEFPPIKKTQQGQHTTVKGGRVKGNYAGLEDIARAVDPALHRHGLTYNWNREVIGDREYVVCTLEHEGGHEWHARFPALMDEGRGRSTLQSWASGETYAKRYSLIAVLGITTVDPDLDGADEPRLTGAPISEKQAANLMALCDEVGEPHVGNMLAWARIDRIEDMPANLYTKAVKALEDKR